MTRGLIGVLLSGRGSNFKAILEGCRRGEIPGTIGIVISDNPNAQGWRRAPGNPGGGP